MPETALIQYRQNLAGLRYCDTIEPERTLPPHTPYGAPGANSTASTGSKIFRMASIYPFRAWRYNPSAVRLDDVVTQPYDKISPAMQQAYYQRSPYNLVRIILGLPELFDAERGESVYTRAARDFRAWREQGVLVQEKDPCIFAYAQQLPRSRKRRSEGTARLHRPRQAPRLRRPGGLPPRADPLQAQERPPQPAQGHARALRPDLHALLRSRRQRGEDSLRRRRSRRSRSHRRIRRAAPPLARQRSGRHSPAHRRHGRQEAHHRRRPPPLRDRAELFQRTCAARRPRSPSTAPASCPSPPIPKPRS